MYLYNKNILKYVEIVGSEPKSMILNTEGRSSMHYSVVPLRYVHCTIFRYYCLWAIPIEY